MNIISPSIMCVDFLSFQKQIEMLDAAGVDWYHIDIMDGHYVPNFALSTYTMQTIADISKTPMDVHLMVTNPEAYIETFAKAGASVITAHLETLTHPIRVMKQIRSLGKKAGIAINPATDIAPLAYMTDFVDLVCVMTVDPGFAGQTLIPSTVGKISAVRKLFSDAGKDVDIMVDGQVKEETAHTFVEAGANVLVLGSSGLFKFKPEEYRKAVDYYQNL